MARWAPDARERLETAALDLFVANGYEQTTVGQIADRAGLNRATFFRHFADKREVILAGDDALGDLFTDAIRTAAAGATVAECLQAALAAADNAMTSQRRATATRRIQVVATNSELQERGQLKFARVTTAIADVLRERGIDDLTARLAAEIGMLAFRIAFQRWLQSANGEPFPTFAAQALDDLQQRASDLHTRT